MLYDVNIRIEDPSVGINSSVKSYPPSVNENPCLWRE